MVSRGSCSAWGASLPEQLGSALRAWSAKARGPVAFYRCREVMLPRPALALVKAPQSYSRRALGQVGLVEAQDCYAEALGRALKSS